MFCQTPLFIESFATSFTVQSKSARVFRLVILLGLHTLENFTAKLAWKASTFMASHVQIKIVAIAVAFATHDTTESEVACVVLDVLVNPRLRVERFATHAAFQQSDFCVHCAVSILGVSQCLGVGIGPRPRSRHVLLLTRKQSLFCKYSETSPFVLEADVSG